MIKLRSTSPSFPSDEKRFNLRPLTAAVTSALVAPFALAQDADNANAEEDENRALEEVYVTATKRTTSIQDVPQSISAFSTAEIERRGMLDMADIASNLPSISLSSDRAGVNELVYRGISSGGSWVLDSQVAMYLDDMPMTASTTQLDPRMVDIARVESLPGPQGTLFGSSSQAGTLRVITNKPQFDSFHGQFNAELKTTDGGEMSYDFNGFLNVPISDDFALRFVAYTAKEGGYVDNVYSTAPHSGCTPGSGCDLDFAYYGVVDKQGYLNSATPDNAGLEEDDFNDYEITGGRISALWNINEDWSLHATLMHQDSETTGVWWSDTALGDYKVARFSDEWRTDKWSTFAFTVTGDLGFAEFSNAFGYADRTQAYQFDNTHYEAYHTRLKGQYWAAWKNWYDTYWGYPVYQYNYYDKYDTEYNGGVYRSLQDAERFTNEIRLTSTGDSRFQWMVGAFYEDNTDGWADQGDIPNLQSTKHWSYTQWRSCDLQGQGYPVSCPAFDPGNTWYKDTYDREVKQTAVFGEVGFDFTDQLNLTVGYRWFEYDRYVVRDRQWPPGLPVEAILLDGEGASIEDGDESDHSYKINLSYNVDDDIMVYGLYSNGFRLGGRNNPKAVRVNFVPEFYDPDVVNNYEIGMKSEWLDNRLQVNVTAFHMEWEDMQLSFGSDQGGLWWLNGKANGGGGENTGFELDFNYQVNARLRLSGQVYMGDAEYTEDYITPEGVLQLSAGTSMQDAADEKVSVAFDYTFPNAFRGGDAWLRFDTYYVGPLYSRWSAAAAANPNSPDYVPGSKENVDSFTKSNVQLGYESEKGWSATLMVRNLFNEEANTNTGGVPYYAEFWGHSGFGETNNLARPRTISVKMSYPF